MILRVIETTGDDELARVFIGELSDGARIEFVESVQPPVPRTQKWVLIVSTLKGCPVGCPICDAGGGYRGKLGSEEIIAQVEHMIRRRYPDGRVLVPKLKIQFARMGDPALNDAVLDVLLELPGRMDIPGLMPAISTVAPWGRDSFMERLAQIKSEFYPNGRFQMQFSVHTTDAEARRKLIPVRTWNLDKMSEYGERFFEEGDRKIALNFAPVKGFPLEPSVIGKHFDPRYFMIKLTPVNPTFAAENFGLAGLINPTDSKQCSEVVKSFTDQGFDTILSIGDTRENAIGSNCGMYVEAGRRAATKSDN